MSKPFSAIRIKTNWIVIMKFVKQQFITNIYIWHCKEENNDNHYLFFEVGKKFLQLDPCNCQQHSLFHLRPLQHLLNHQAAISYWWTENLKFG